MITHSGRFEYIILPGQWPGTLIKRDRTKKKERAIIGTPTFLFFRFFLRITYRAAIVLVIKKKKLEVVRAIVKLIFIIACLRTFGQLVIWAKIWWSFFLSFVLFLLLPLFFFSKYCPLQSRQAIDKAFLIHLLTQCFTELKCHLGG